MLNAGFENTYSRLPARFYSRTDPTPVAAPRLIRFNGPLAAELGIEVDASDAEGIAQVLGGNRILAGSEPLAMAYAGHQFGHFVPQLGDGRAILLGEVRARDGALRDIQLKGAGRTPFSRGGDGRAALGPVLREYIVSEAMTALGIPSTRTLAAVSTGQTVLREEPLPGGVLTRIAASHVRVGTFQYFAARDDYEAVRTLADYVIERHYPELKPATAPYLELLKAVIRRQASLVAKWLHVGFIHGVMNTDNCTVSGETIDFGPCAFMDAYDANKVFSSIDQHGRYAYSNQPSIAQWNLVRLAETLLPLIDVNEARAIELATESINAFAGEVDRHWLEGMRAKLGLRTADPRDPELAQGLLAIMQRTEADFTLTFRSLCSLAESNPRAEANDALNVAWLGEDSPYAAWLSDWRARCAGEPLPGAQRAAAMRAVNPKFIPRNHRIEELIEAAVEREDFSLFDTLLSVLAKPFDEQPQSEAYAVPPRPEQRVAQTFCGT
jgi:serine/tyrosine/threonine adenylyltransferase